MTRARTRPTARPPAAAAPVLTEVAYQARLAGLLAEVRLTQVYRNPGEGPLEAVFTFPVPVEAVLLELEVELGERRLQGLVMPRPQAAEAYEDAIADGDAAILVEQAAPGLYTVNCGNLLPGEQARLHLRWTELLAWQGDTVRFWLPTTLAPRYGDPATAGLAPHQLPGVDLTLERACSIEVEVQGPLARAVIASPTHAIATASRDGNVRVRLTRQTAAMDRDFVLTLTAAEADRTFALREEDDQGTTLWASFCPDWDESEDRSPRCLQLVVDCSGSMAGDSIEQARLALTRILDELRPEDTFNLIRFGSTAHALFDRARPAGPEQLAAARELLAGLDADLGGTEIAGALQTAYADGTREPGSADLLLITDGEVWQTDEVVAAAQASGYRFFCVGVGSAVAEAFLRQLSRRTNGACELVSPGEEMADRILHHFRRIWATPVAQAAITWPGPATAQVPAHLDGLYRGQTVHLLARCSQPVNNTVGLDLTLADGRTVHREAPLAPAPWERSSLGLLPRLAAARRLREESLPEEEATRLAVEHRLVSPHTCMLVVAVRAAGEKAQELPELHQISHMLAAGWGGTGSVVAHAPAAMSEPGISCCIPSAAVMESALPYPTFLRRNLGDRATSARPTSSRPPKELFPASAPPPPPEQVCQEALDQYQQAISTGAARIAPGLPDAFVRSLCLALARGDAVETIIALADLGLPPDLADVLQTLVDADHPEFGIVAVLVHLIVMRLPGKVLDRQTRRRLRQAWRQAAATPDWATVEQRLEQLLSGENPT